MRVGYRKTYRTEASQTASVLTGLLLTRGLSVKEEEQEESLPCGVLGIFNLRSKVTKSDQKSNREGGQRTSTKEK